MKASINLTVPIVPKKNSKTARITRAGRAYLHRKASAITSQDAIHWEALDLLGKAGWKSPVLDRISMLLVFPHHPQADAIGLAETILDALEGVAYKNDRQVKLLVIEMLKKNDPSWASYTSSDSCHLTITTL